jgi:hypothetical protein
MQILKTGLFEQSETPPIRQNFDENVCSENPPPPPETLSELKDFALFFVVFLRVF